MSHSNVLTTMQIGSGTLRLQDAFEHWADPSVEESQAFWNLSDILLRMIADISSTSFSVASDFATILSTLRISSNLSRMKLLNISCHFSGDMLETSNPTSSGICILNSYIGFTCYDTGKKDLNIPSNSGGNEKSMYWRSMVV